MLENQIITFSETIDPHDCGMALPVVFGGKGVTFFIPARTEYEQTLTPTISLESANGDIIAEQLYIWLFAYGNQYCEGILGDFNTAEMMTGRKHFPASIAGTVIAPDECFRVRITYRATSIGEVIYEHIWHSCLLRRSLNTDKGLSHLEYGCRETAEVFGFPFMASATGACLTPLRMWMPIMARKPSYGQKDSIYEKLNGERVVMYAAVTKEYECESDYIPEEWHRKLVIALSCDETYIDGERLTKSDKYDINWNNVYRTDCGVKCAKATWKMSANVTQRNTMQ